MEIIMSGSSMGQFMAALRKASGMTQQEVAQRLNVSNKAVSRWERDECAPDISLLPAIAEMFGVSCDELIRGRRSAQVQGEVKFEKRIKTVINRAISKFETMMWISVALSAAGFICNLAISYGFYRVIIGFAVMLLFCIAAAIVAVSAVNKMKEAKNDNELFEGLDGVLIGRFNSTLGNRSFAAFFAVFAVVLFSLPLVLFKSEQYVESVLSIQSYFGDFFFVIALILALVFLKLREPCASWITEGKILKRAKGEEFRAKRKMSALQLGLTLLAGVLFVLGPCFENKPYQTSVMYGLCVALGLSALLGNIVTFAVFEIRNKAFRKALAISGVRNILMIFPAFIVSELHWVAFAAGAGEPLRRVDGWQWEYLRIAVTAVVVIAAVFEIINNAVRCCKKEGVLN